MKVGAQDDPNLRCLVQGSRLWVSWCFRGLYIGIMENKMETAIVCWGNIGIMEKKMETTKMGLYKA